MALIAATCLLVNAHKYVKTKEKQPPLLSIKSKGLTKMRDDAYDQPLLSAGYRQYMVTDVTSTQSGAYRVLRALHELGLV